MINPPISIFILGATGSIGQFTLQAMQITQGSLYGFTFYSNIELARQITRSYRPKVIFCPHTHLVEQMRKEFPSIKVFSTKIDLFTFLAQDDTEFTVINGISGPTGIEYTYQTLISGRKLLLANKESIILGGKWILQEQQYKNQIIPIDSEHFSLFILLQAFPISWIKHLCITASGGPFLNYTVEQIKDITPQQAMKHPIWDMGSNISLSSATLANKGLEVLEAKELFGFSMDKIQVRIHPEAQTHALLFLYNNSWVSHQYYPSMEVPIAQALVYPEIPLLNPEKYQEPMLGQQSFMQPNWEQFPMLQMAYDVGQSHHSQQMIYTLANDIANSLFLKEKISFVQIAEFVKFNLEKIQTVNINNISDLLDLKDYLHIQIINNTELFI